MENNFKEGDLIRRTQDAMAGGNYCNTCGPNGVAANCRVTSIKGGYVYATCPNGTKESFMCSTMELVTKNTKPDDMTRYMAYGFGCSNKSDMLMTEKDLKNELDKCVKDSSWSGKIIGYKLVPLYEVETKTVLKSLTRVRKSRAKSKRPVGRPRKK